MMGVVVQAWDSLQQAPRIGLPWIAQDLCGLATLDDGAGLHHTSLWAEALDQGEIVGDEQIGQPQLAAQFGEQIQNLRL